MMNVLSGLHRPDRGFIEFDGRRIEHLSPHQIARLGICRTFQTSAIFSELDVLENLICGQSADTPYGLVDAIFQNRKMTKAEAAATARAQRLMSRLGLDELMVTRGAQHMSFGQQRLVEIARAILNSPKLLLLDEPAVGLAKNRVEELATLIRSTAAETGAAVLLIEHAIDLVINSCDRVVVLNAGKVIANDEPGAIVSNPEVVESYLGRKYYAAR